MKKIAALAEDQYQVLEVWYPYLRFREVVVDGILITSRNPYDLPAFCAEIIKKLK